MAVLESSLWDDSLYVILIKKVTDYSNYNWDDPDYIDN